MNVLLLQVAHWHFERYYLPTIAASDVNVVAVSDGDVRTRLRIASRCGCRAHADWRDAIDTPGADFAFVFGPHAEMPAIGAALVARGIPFAIEKPAGTTVRDVSALHAAAEAKGVFASVAFAYRTSELLGQLQAHFGPGSPPGYISVRNLAGPPSRYLANGNPWMLSRQLAGGGCTMNVGIHFIDLVRVLTGQEIVGIQAKLGRMLFDTEVEDYSTMILTLADGCVATIETGYTFPAAISEAQEFSLSVASRDHHLRSVDESFRLYHRATGNWTDIPIRRDERMYARYIERTLDDVRNGRPPIASLADAVAALDVVERAYAADHDARLAVES
ncbi:MAG: Gfo/Idh/MocA family oxidoreductase [Pseudomonadota bacterium]|nr:Gfo/Idh/MocA family oxidoreductase [Pseudomonadota bacterium]